MHLPTLPLLLAFLPPTAASPPSLCDKYSQSLFNGVDGTSQANLLTQMVNLALAGNSTTTPPVTGILNPGSYSGAPVSLYPYFDGSLVASSQGDDPPTSMNFMDGGGITPLTQGLPADNTTSNQYTFVTHLYQFFGAMLRCSSQGQPSPPSTSPPLPYYAGRVSMYTVHAFMALSWRQVSYHNYQVQLAALALGFSPADAAAVFATLQYVFNARCAPPTAVVTNAGAAAIQHAVCANVWCPMEMGSNCTGYEFKGVRPRPKTATATAGTGGGGGGGG